MWPAENIIQNNVGPNGDADPTPIPSEPFLEMNDLQQPMDEQIGDNLDHNMAPEDDLGGIEDLLHAAADHEAALNNPDLLDNQIAQVFDEGG